MPDSQSRVARREALLIPIYIIVRMHAWESPELMDRSGHEQHLLERQLLRPCRQRRQWHHYRQRDYEQRSRSNE